MSIENRNRVAKGVSTGGQFATESKSEAAGVSLANHLPVYTDPNTLPPVSVQLHLQRWEWDEAVTVEEIEVDARTLFAAMDREELEDLMGDDNGGAGDKLYEQARKDGLAKDWDGPYEFYAEVALQDLRDENPEAIDQLADAQLDPDVTYRSVDGRLASSDETWEEDCEAQYSKFEQVKRDTALMQLKGRVKKVSEACPDAKTLNFSSDGNLGDPVYLKSITRNDGSEIDADQVQGLEPSDFEFAPGGAIAEFESYGIEEIRDFRASV